MKYRIILLIVLSGLFLSSPLFAEFVFLTDGKILEGQITNETADTIVLRTSGRKTYNIKRSTIMRILYTELKMGKVYVQKRDGESVLAFIVDENRDSFTFRKDLNKPQEFVLKREDVLFIAEKNPSGLKVNGEPGQKSISLKWLPPYDVVKKYNVYVKEKKTDKYEFIKSSQSKSTTVTGLKSNTEYYIIVRSVDSDNYESSPSNEIRVTTKNIPPSKPPIKAFAKNGSGEQEIKWDESTDIDGTVKIYKVYGILNNKKELISETKKTGILVKDAKNYTRYKISAVDNNGDESKFSDVYKNTLSVRFTPEMVYAIGSLNDLFSAGYGASMDLSYNGLFFYGTSLSVNTGYLFWIGNSDNIDYMNMFPLIVSVGYRYNFSSKLSVFVSAGAGMVFMSTAMTDATMQEVTVNGNEFVFSEKLGINYELNEKFLITCGGKFYTVYESNGLESFAGAEIGIIYKIF